MGIGARHLRDLLRGLVSTDPAERSAGADGVSDWAQFLSGPEGMVASYAIGCLAMIETDQECLEAELHALSKLAEWDLAPRFVMDELKHLDATSLNGSARVHYDNFVTRMALGPGLATLAGIRV